MILAHFRTKYIALFFLHSCHQVFALPRTNLPILENKIIACPCFLSIPTENIRKYETGGIYWVNKLQTRQKIKTKNHDQNHL